MLKDSKEYHYITEIIKEAKKEIERFLPIRVDDLYDYVDYEDIKKVTFLINKKGFKLSEKDLERFFTEELERLAYKKFKEWVELRNPKNEIDIIKLFLKYDIELRDEIEEIIDDVGLFGIYYRKPSQIPYKDSSRSQY